MHLQFLRLLEAPSSLLAHDLPILGSTYSMHSEIQQDNWCQEQDQQCNTSFYSFIFLFITKSVNKHLGCFHVLAIVNSAATNVEEHVSLQIRISSGYMPKSRIAISYGNSVLSFWGLSMLVSILVDYIPTNGVGAPSPLFTKQLLFYWIFQVKLLHLKVPKQPLMPSIFFNFSCFFMRYFL